MEITLVSGWCCMTEVDQYLVYGRKSCEYCVKAVELLQSIDCSFQFISTEKDLDFLQELKIFYKHETVPIILRISGKTGYAKFIGGYSDLKEFISD